MLDDALQLLINQGEVFASSGIIYLQPNYVTRLLKPLVDHRLSRATAKPHVEEHIRATVGVLAPIDAATKLLSAVDVLSCGAGRATGRAPPRVRGQHAGMH